MKLYVVYRNDMSFYGWTDDKLTMKQFKKFHGRSFKYKIIHKEIDANDYNPVLDEYRIDAMFEGQVETPLLLRNIDFAMLESSMNQDLLFLSRCIDELISHISLFRMDKLDKKMMISILRLISQDSLEVASDDEPVYSDIINILEYYKYYNKPY